MLGVQSAAQVGSVPEASSWFMLIMGIGFVGFA
ncbi:PEP-CTERM sorting domain-containing protein [Novosphingobium chloroacetimidivorans]